MKNIFFALAVVVLLCGCASYTQAVAKLEQQMTPEWLKENIIVGKTTTADIETFYGPPMVRTSSSGSGFGAALMPDEIWTYSVQFSKTVNTWLGGRVDYTTRTVTFSFKGGTVSDYHVSTVAF